MRLIAGHPQLALAAAVSDSCAGRDIGNVFGHLSQALAGHTFKAHDQWLEQLKHGSELALFSAAPHGASAA
ncbi:MAG: N-acetyl-gamma-glutamyl-phosphate reductase, partial [Woeseiaceae bacterium]|nr:N-acetyl-gamma-glutamyl-phosphate reductase [Woeseiaceae bacterium]